LGGFIFLNTPLTYLSKRVVVPGGSSVRRLELDITNLLGLHLFDIWPIHAQRFFNIRGTSSLHVQIFRIIMQEHGILILVLDSSRRSGAAASFSMMMTAAAVNGALRPVAMYSRMLIIISVVIKRLEVVVVGLEICQLVLLDQMRLLFIEP
jgi:hypothetical protein